MTINTKEFAQSQILPIYGKVCKDSHVTREWSFWPSSMQQKNDGFYFDCQVYGLYNTSAKLNLMGFLNILQSTLHTNGNMYIEEYFSSYLHQAMKNMLTLALQENSCGEICNQEARNKSFGYYNRAILQNKNNREQNIVIQTTKVLLLLHFAMLPGVYQHSDQENSAQVTSSTAVAGSSVSGNDICSDLETWEKEVKDEANSELSSQCQTVKEASSNEPEELCNRKQPTIIEIEITFPTLHIFSTKPTYFINDKTCSNTTKIFLDHSQSKSQMHGSSFLNMCQVKRRNKHFTLEVSSIRKHICFSIAERRIQAKKSSEILACDIFVLFLNFLQRNHQIIKNIVLCFNKNGGIYLCFLVGQHIKFRNHIKKQSMIKVNGENNVPHDRKIVETAMESRSSLPDSCVESQNQTLKTSLAKKLMLEKHVVEGKQEDSEVSRIKTLISDVNTSFKKQQHSEVMKDTDFLSSAHDPNKLKDATSLVQNDSSFLCTFLNNTADLRPCSSVRNNVVNMLGMKKSIKSGQQIGTVHGLPWAVFERETMRLASYSHYPALAVKSSILLAASGFVYIGDGTSDKVKCFFCLAEKEGWQATDNIDEVHLALSPSCPLAAVQSSNNVVSGISLPTTAGAAFTNTESFDITARSEANVYEEPYYSDSSSENSPWSEESILTGGGARDLIYDTVEVDCEREEEDELLETNRLCTSNRRQSITASVPSLSQNVGSASNHGEPRSTRAILVSSPGFSQHLTNSAQSSSFVFSDSPSQNASSTPQNRSSNNTRSQISDDTKNYDQNLIGSGMDPQIQHFSICHPSINSQIYSIPVTPNDLLASSSNASIQASNDTPSTSVHEAQLSYQTLNIFYEKPKHPDYAILARRLLSFEGWPEDHAMKPEDLAKAGFYFVGYGDSCKCFFCGGGLRRWKPEDHPFVEHARCYKNCGYILQCMGQEFVNAVQELNATNKTAITYIDVAEHMRQKGQAIGDLLDNHMIANDVAVKSLVDEGYSAETVYRAVQSVKEKGMALSADTILAEIKALSADTILAEIREEDINMAASVVKSLDAQIKQDKAIVEKLKEGNNNMRNNLMCKICLDNEVQTVFLPCGHFISCQECAFALQDCPLCRSHIRATVRAKI